MNIGSNWIQDVRARIERRLETLLDEKRSRAEAFLPEATILVETVRDMTLRGGKRVRPALLVAGYQAVANADDLAPIVDASVAAELLQTYLLIHDDWMDGDLTRRGKPTIHVSLADHFGDAHVGASLAVLAGNLASAYAWEALCSSSFGDDRIRAALAAFMEMHEHVVAGQLLDLTGAGSIEVMHMLKTASYTVRGPLRIGAILGGASDEQLHALDGYARAIGIAFQLRDDILGTFGDSSVTGKSAASDLRAGKKTALIDDAMKRASVEDRAEIARAFGRSDASDEDVRAAARALERCGARERVERRSEELLAEALRWMDGAPFTEAGLGLLRSLAPILARRTA